MPIPVMKRFFSLAVLLLSLPIFSSASPAVGEDRQFPNPQPYPQLHFEARSSVDPAQHIYIVRVSLTDPDVDVRVAAGGPDPDGAGEYQTTLQTPSTIAEREHFEIAINGDFFSAQKTVDVEGAKSGFVTGKWAKAVGPAVTDGYLWAPASEPRAALLFDSHKRARIAMVKEVPEDAVQVIAGSNVIVRDGEVSVEAESSFSRTRHPRTAVGIDRDGKTLVMVVVDGRRAGQAVGMSLTELANLMRELGCRDALNLDGGGSSELVMRRPRDGQLEVVNRPSDGRERAVANVLGISIRSSHRSPQLQPALHTDKNTLGPDSK